MKLDYGAGFILDESHRVVCQNGQHTPSKSGLPTRLLEPVVIDFNRFEIDLASDTQWDSASHDTDPPTAIAIDHPEGGQQSHIVAVVLRAPKSAQGNQALEAFSVVANGICVKRF